MSFYPRLFEAGLYNKGAGNVFLLKELTSKFPTKYTFKTGTRIENRGRVSWDELIKDIKNVVAEYNLDVDPASIQVKSLKKAEGGISDKYPTLFFNIDGKDFKVKFSGAGSGEQMTQTPTVFKEGLVCYFFSTRESYAAFSKRKPAEKEAGYVSLLDTMIKDITKTGIKGLNEKDKTKILDILKKEIVTYNGDILNAIFNAMSVGNKLRSNKFVGGRFIPWEVYRDDFFNNMKSEAAVGIGFPSKASDKWNPMDILLVMPGKKAEIEKRWAEAAQEENKDLKLGKYNSIFLDELDSENPESVALAISLKEEKAQAGKGKSYLDSIETLKERYNITLEEKSWDTEKLMSKIANLRKNVITTLKKNNVENLFLYKKETGEFAKPESALSKYGSMKMLNYLLSKVDEKNNIFIDLAAYSLSLGKNPTFFKFIANKDGDADEVNVHRFEAKGGISLYDITKYKTFDNYDGKIWITDNNNNAGIQITYYIVLASVVYIANLVIRTGGSTQVFIEIQKFKELKDLTENKNEDMFYPRLFEKFKEQSDSVRDMDIGAKPDEIFQQFLEDFIKEFRIEPFVDYSGHVYDVQYADVYLIQGQHEEKEHPINKLIGNFESEYELNFARTDKAADAILKSGKWGFYYWIKGKVIELQSKDLHGVIKEIIKIRRLQRRGFVKRIETYNSYIKEVEKILEIVDEDS